MLFCKITSKEILDQLLLTLQTQNFKIKKTEHTSNKHVAFYLRGFNQNNQCENEVKP